MTAKLANYTTTISANKTVMDIQRMLQEHGATSILVNYKNTDPESLSFIIPTIYGNLPFRLPVQIDKVDSKLKQMKVRHVYNPNQSAIDSRKALDVGWRNIYYWLRAQLALIEIDQVTFDQVFLPYLQQSGSRSLYEVIIEKHFLLNQGTNENGR
jgi:hypothetical protein